MICPHCESPRSRVTDSRIKDSWVRRRRQCLGCKSRYTTYEIGENIIASLEKIEKFLDRMMVFSSGYRAQIKKLLLEDKQSG